MKSLDTFFTWTIVYEGIPLMRGQLCTKELVLITHH